MRRLNATVPTLPAAVWISGHLASLPEVGPLADGDSAYGAHAGGGSARTDGARTDGGVTTATTRSRNSRP